MKYPCLVLDHDDTVVNSTATIHYPAFREFMKISRPENLRFTLDEYFLYNFDPGVIGFFRDICHLSPEEMTREEAFWKEFVKGHVPAAYPGMREILWNHKEKGGLICVASHSFSHYVKRDYEQNSLPEPDRIFGWDLEPSLRKPSPYALQEIMKEFSLSPSELLVLDDLKPGYDMARAAGVPFAASGWASNVPQIEAFMRKNCDYYFKTVEEFAAFLDE